MQGDSKWQLAQVRLFAKEITESTEENPIPALLRLRSVLQSSGLSQRVPPQLFDCVVKLGVAAFTNDSRSYPMAMLLFPAVTRVMLEYPDVFSKNHISLFQRWQQGDMDFFKQRLDQIRVQQQMTAPAQEAPRRLRYVETVLNSRTSRFAIVLELTHDGRNEHAILRTAEALGVQHIFVVRSPDMKNEPVSFSKKITKGNDSFLTIREFETTTACIQAVRQDGWEIWATDLSPESVALDSAFPTPLPRKLAVVFGRETDGCSEQILKEAERRIYIPLFGFSESLNLSVAAGMVMQHLFLLCPEARGDLSIEEKAMLRSDWYVKLTKGKEHKLAKYQRYLDNPPAPLEDLRRDDKEIFIKPKVKRKMEQIRASSVAAAAPDEASKKAKTE